MKGIVLAGGQGTRIYPATSVISKQLLPIYNKPMIYYSLSVLMLANIREVLLISSPEHIHLYEELFGNGSHLGMNISYAVQDQPRGIADSFIVGEEFINGDNVCLILGDNVFHGHGLTSRLSKAATLKQGGVVFGYYVNDPREYGVLEIDNHMRVLGVEEKPQHPKSNYAIPGLYFLTINVCNMPRMPSHLLVEK